MNKNLTRGCGGPLIEGDFSLKNLIKKIGKGPKLSQDLTFTEAKHALLQILDGQAFPEQIGAFFIAERMKSESIEETAGMIAALRERSVPIKFSGKKLIELACAHDGKNKSYVLSPFVGAILALAGVSVLLTGAQDVPTKKGITPGMIFDHLGAARHTTGSQIEDCLHQHGLAYADMSVICPDLEKLKPLRHMLGLRTCLNTIEKAINPANADYFCSGVFHGPYLLVLTSALQQLGDQNILCVQATEASTDLPLKKRVLYRSCLQGVLQEQSEIDPAHYNLKRDQNPEFVKNTASENVEEVGRALTEKKGLIYDALIYNAAVQFWFSQHVPSIAAGIELAKDVIADGGVMEKIKNLK